MDWFADGILMMMLAFIGIFIIFFFAVAFYAVFKALKKAPMGPISNSTVKEKEIVKQIIKVRCPYCTNIYDETLDECPHCGGKHP